MPLPVERHSNANRLKASEIEEKIGVNIKSNIDPDFLFDLRELLIRFSLVPFNWKGYISWTLCEENGKIEAWNKILQRRTSPDRL